VGSSPSNVRSTECSRLRCRGRSRRVGSLCCLSDWQIKRKQEETLVWGPYTDSPTKFRLKLTENGETRNVGFKTEKEAKVVKAKLLGKESQPRKRTIGATIQANLSPVSPPVRRYRFLAG